MNEEKKIVNRVIKSAIPTMAQNLSYPIYVLIDTMIIGHILGVEQLAALNVGSTILSALCGVCVFLSYLMNGSVSRLIGAGDRRGAVELGRNGLWLAVFLGITLMAVILIFAEPICALFTADPVFISQSSIFLRASSFSLLGGLIQMATNGILRGLNMYKIPMYITIGGVTLNTLLNVLFVIVFQWGIFGSGFASSVASFFCASVNFAIVLYFVHKEKVSRRLDVFKVFATFKESIPFIVRSVILWFSILIMLKVIAGLGAEFSAAYQITMAIWTFEEIVLEALEIPLQSLIGERVGAKDRDGAKRVLNLTISLTMKVAAIFTVTQIALAFLTPQFFTPDKNVQFLASVSLLESALIFFHASFAFLMDGAFIGAADTPFMAQMCGVSALIYVPISLLLIPFLPHTWIGFLIALAMYDFVFLGIRAVLALWRFKTERWLKRI